MKRTFGIVAAAGLAVLVGGCTEMPNRDFSEDAKTIAEIRGVTNPYIISRKDNTSICKNGSNQLYIVGGKDASGQEVKLGICCICEMTVCQCYQQY